MNLKTTLTFIGLGLLISAASFLNFSSNSEVLLTQNNHIFFGSQVTDESVAKAQIEIAKLSKALPDSGTIYLVIDSPGGSVSAGNLFIDFARSLPQTIKPICIFCASMGYHMFQSFNERIVLSSSTLMSHRASLGGIGGQVPGELESRLAWIKRALNIMDASVAKRVGISVQAYQKLIYDELWLDGTTAVSLKHADSMPKIRCSSALVDGVKTQVVMTMFGPVEVTQSQCPLINGILDAKLVKSSPTSVPATKENIIREIRRVKRNVKMEF